MVGRLPVVPAVPAVFPFVATPYRVTFASSHPSSRGREEVDPLLGPATVGKTAGTAGNAGKTGDDL